MQIEQQMVTENCSVDMDIDMHSECDIVSEPQLMAWDERTDDLSVPEYAEDIMDNLMDREEPMGDFMNGQQEVSVAMRCQLVDWLVEVHRMGTLSRSTYFLAINLVDRYLAQKNIGRAHLQLLGCTCLWIAAKYHEKCAPAMGDFVQVSGGAFSAPQLTAMETEVLKTLSFELTVPTVLSYAERYSQISSHYLKKQADSKIVADLMMYCIEHSVLSYELCQSAPSLIGAACFVYSSLSTKVFSEQTLRADGLEDVIAYSLEEMLPTMRAIHEAVSNAHVSKHRALYKHYCTAKHSKVGKLNFANLDIAFLE